MDSPEFDSNGYPTEATLAAIRDHPTMPARAISDLIAFVTKAWYEDGDVRYEGEMLTLVTGGWSGNESIIDALSNNFGFWSRFWQSSHRGGKYEFKIQL